MTQESIIRVGLYLKGDALMPDLITARVGVNPTDAQYTGQRFCSPRGKERVAKIGMWSLISSRRGNDVSNVLRELLSGLPRGGMKLNELSGVEEAYVDVFICSDSPKDESSNESEFEIDREVVSFIYQLGVSIRFSVSFVEE